MGMRKTAHTEATERSCLPCCRIVFLNLELTEDHEVLGKETTDRLRLLARDSHH